MANNIKAILESFGNDSLAKRQALTLILWFLFLASIFLIAWIQVLGYNGQLHWLIDIIEAMKG